MPQLMGIVVVVLTLVGALVLATNLHAHGVSAGAAASSTGSAPATSSSAPAAPSAALVASSASSAASTPTAPTGPLGVVVFGDSVAAGTNCSNCTAFPQLVADQIGQSQHRTPAVTNESANGLTTADIRKALTNPSVQRAVAASDLVIVEIGANDLDETKAGEDRCADSPATTCYAQSLATAKANLTAVLASVNQLQTRPTAQVVVMGYWNVFQDGQGARANGSNYLSTSVSLTHSFNQMAHGAADDAHDLWADAWTPFRGTSGTRDDTSDLASDGEHPNQAGHRLLATAVLTALGDAQDTL